MSLLGIDLHVDGGLFPEEIDLLLEDVVAFLLVPQRVVAHFRGVVAFALGGFLLFKNCDRLRKLRVVLTHDEQVRVAALTRREAQLGRTERPLIFSLGIGRPELAVVAEEALRPRCGLAQRIHFAQTNSVQAADLRTKFL